MPRIDLASRLADVRHRVGEPNSDGVVAAKYAGLTRKDALIRPDQAVALRDLADELMRKRRVKGERITENTLIRVAIDLLLTHRDRLRGSGEDELRLAVLPTPDRPDHITESPVSQEGS